MCQAVSGPRPLAAFIHIWYNTCMKTVTLNVDEAVYERFQSYARKSGRPASELIREAMAEYAEREVPHPTSIFDGAPHHVGAVLRDLSAEDDVLDEMLS